MLCINLLYYMQHGPTAEVDGALYFPELSQQRQVIDSIVISKDDSEVILTQRHNQWLVESMDYYLADQEKVQQFLSLLSDARIYEVKTSKPEYYKEIQAQTKDNQEQVFWCHFRLINYRF